MAIELNLSTVSVLLISIFALLTFIIYWELCHRQRSKQRLVSGLIWLKHFRSLMILVQQHRGLSNGYLCGDQSLQSRIQPLQSKINQAIHQLEQGGDWLANNPDWPNIKHHWGRLSEGFKYLTPSNSLEQHTKLIMNVLYLIDDCAEQHRLYEMKDKQQRSIRYLWQTLLVTIENIGQARAVGTGVAAAGVCNSVDRIRLSYLHQAIDGVQVETSDRSASNAVTQLLNVLEQRVNIDNPAVSANEYFDIATLALEEVLQHFDNALHELEISVTGVKPTG
jgi:hypothetical protein